MKKTIFILFISILAFSFVYAEQNEKEPIHGPTVIVPLADEGGRATGDDCTDPIIISLPTALPYSDLNQTNCGRGNTYSSTCLGSYDGGEDIIYQLTVTSDVTIDITMNPKGTTWTGMLLDDSCPPDPSTCLYEDTGSSGNRTIFGAALTSAVGTYYIMIDTYPTPDCIPDFDLTITQAAGPQPGDDCTIPITVTLPAALPYSDLGQTNCARGNDYSTTCLGNYDGGEDIIYELTVTSDVTVNITLDPKTSGYSGICIDNTCPPGSPCIDFSTSPGATPHGMTSVALTTAGSPYYIMIDTWPSPTCIPDFDLIITSAAVPPDCATNPDPPDLDTNVQIDANLSWSAGGGSAPTGYKIYFGTDDPPTNIENGTDLVLVTTYDPTPDMAYATMYYWKIVPYNTFGDATGCSIWSFTTQYDPNYGGGGAGQGGYYYANSLATGAPSYPSYSWIDFSGHTVVPIDPSATANKDGSLSDDDYEGPFSIGFSFPYFNSTFTDFYIQSNGLISFTDAEIFAGNDPIPVDGSETDFIAWFWDDMDADDPDVTDTDVRYSSGAAQCVITFWHYPEYGASAGDYVTAQVILYPNGNIKIQYNDAESGPAPSMDYDGNTVGIEGDDAGTAYGIEYRYNGTGGPMFGSDLAVMFGENEGGLPVELTSFTVAVIQNEFISVNWTSQSETNMMYYNIYRSEGIEDMIFIHTEEATNTSTTQDYLYEDHEVEPEITYNYWLEGVDLDGSTNMWGPVSATIEPEIIPEIPEITLLRGNYPNPFNPTTFIQFDIKEGETAELTIYNIRGQVILSKTFEPGTYNYEWDSKDNASGVYFYKLKSESYSEVKKMMILK